MNNLGTTGVSCFHASECQNPPTGSEYEGKSRGLRDSLVIGLSTEIANRNLTILAAAIVTDAWKSAPQGLRDRFSTPYHFCFEFVMQQIVTWSRKYAGREPVALVFAEHKEYANRSTHLYELYRASGAYDGLGSFSTGKPELIIPLQAADMVCYETYQYVDHKEKTGNWVVTPLISKMAAATFGRGRIL